jgi:hypothetical protein
MATMLEEYNTEEQRSGVHFLWTKGLYAKDVHKEMFPVYSGMCVLRKVFTAGSRNVANISLMTKRLKRRYGIG